MIPTIIPKKSLLLLPFLYAAMTYGVVRDNANTQISLQQRDSGFYFLKHAGFNLNARHYGEALKDYNRAKPLLLDPYVELMDYQIRDGMGKACCFLGDYPRAINLFEQCQAYYKGKNDEVYLEALYYLSLSYYMKGDYNSSSLIPITGANECKRLGNADMEAYFWQVLGLNSFSNGKYAEAIQKLDCALSVMIARNDYQNEALTNLYIGKSYWALQQQAKAIPYFKKVAYVCRQQQYYHPSLREAYERLIEFYGEDGDEQLDYINQLQIADRIMKKEYPKLFGTISSQYNEAALEQLSHEHQRHLLICWFTAAIVLGAVSFFALSYYKRRQGHKASTEEPVLQEIPGTALTVDISEELAGSILKKLEAYESDKKYLDSADIKQLFNISDKTLYRWRKEGHIPFVKIGGKRVYPKKAVLAILQARLDNKYDPINIKAHQKRD